MTCTQRFVPEFAHLEIFLMCYAQAWQTVLLTPVLYDRSDIRPFKLHMCDIASILVERNASGENTNFVALSIAMLVRAPSSAELVAQ